MRTAKDFKFRVWDGLMRHIELVDFGFSINCPVMLFTGLEDCEGAEIYEGDIILTSASQKFVVIWCSDVAQFQICSPDKLEPDQLGITFILLNDGYRKAAGFSYRVIGNIYENPELLEVAA